MTNFEAKLKQYMQKRNFLVKKIFNYATKSWTCNLQTVCTFI